MSFDQSWIDNDKLLLQTQLNDYRAMALFQKQALLGYGESEVAEGKWLDRFKSLTHFYIDLSLFPDEEVVEGFLKQKLSKFWLKWLISWSEIERVLDNIELKNIFVVRYPLLVLTKTHLTYKILFEMQTWADVVYKLNSDEVTGAHKILFDAYRARKKGGPKRFRDKSDIDRHQSLGNMEADYGRDEVKSDLLAISRGDTKFLLKTMINAFMNKSGLSEADYCDVIYDFYSLIMKDDELMYRNENEFLKKAPVSYSTFKIYKHSRIRDLFLT